MIHPTMNRGFGNIPDVNDLETIPYFGRYLSSVFFVLCWEKYRFHTGSIGSNKLLLNSPDSLNMTGKLKLALSSMLAYFTGRCLRRIWHLQSLPLSVEQVVLREVR